MSGNFHTSGCVTESDLKTFTLEHNDKLNSKIKSTLRKIHKLKRENRTLSSRRKEIIKATDLDSKIWLKTVTECILTGREFNGVRQSCENNAVKRQTQLNKISEQIGKNSSKIQRLRTLIGQDKAWENRPRLLDPRKIVYVE